MLRICPFISQQLLWIWQVETMESVVEQLLETLKYLSDAELKRFQNVLAPLSFPEKYEVVLYMIQAYSQESVEKTKKVLKEMERTDLVQRLSDSSCRLESKTIDKSMLKSWKWSLIFVS